MEGVPTMGEIMVEDKEVAGLIQGQQLEHVATVVPSVKRDSVLPMGKISRIITRITLLTYVGNAKGRGLLASTITMVLPSRVETTTEETSETTVVSWATMAATEATGVATSHAETFTKYKLMISYRTSSRNEAATTAMMIMLMTQMVPHQSYSMNTITVVCEVSFATKPDSSANCTNVHVIANPNHMVHHSVNATSATNVHNNSCYLKANVQISSKTKHVNIQLKVDTEADINLLPLDLYHKFHPNPTAKSLLKDPSVHLFAYNISKIQYFGICPLQVILKVTA